LLRWLTMPWRGSLSAMVCFPFFDPQDPRTSDRMIAIAKAGKYCFLIHFLICNIPVRVQSQGDDHYLLQI
jgi:hypothetical protein